MSSGTVKFVDEAKVRETVLRVFDELRNGVAALLPDAEIERIGSTSTPGALTKGDLDICVLVEQKRLPASRPHPRRAFCKECRFGSDGLPLILR